MKRMALFCLLLMSVVTGVLAENRVLNAKDCGIYRYGEESGYTFQMFSRYLSKNIDANDKKSFWESVKKRHDDGTEIPIIFQLHFDKDGTNCGYKNFPPFENCKEQLDAFFKSTDDCPTYPELLFGVTLDEENKNWDGQILPQQQLSKYLRETYHVKVYHWLTEPLKPTLDLEGDGWVLDAYDVQQKFFYSHLEAFVLTGKPVVPILWASGHFDNFPAFRNMDWNDLTHFSLHRIACCRALNLPVMLFAVSQEPYGSVGGWFNFQCPEEEEKYRRRILEALHEPACTYPLVVPEKKIILTCTPDAPEDKTIDLTNFHLVNYTHFDNVRNWELTKDGLLLKADEGGLLWELEVTDLPLNVEIKLYYSEGTEGSFNDQPLAGDSCSVKIWALTKYKLFLKGKKGMLLKKIEIKRI